MTSLSEQIYQYLAVILVLLIAVVIRHGYIGRALLAVKQWRLDRQYRKCHRAYSKLSKVDRDLISYMGGDPESMKERGAFDIKPPLK